MKLNITYTKEKDIENFLKGLRAVNNRNNTSVMEEFLRSYDEFTKENLSIFIDKYIKKEKYDIPELIKKAKEQWGAVEDVFIQKCEKMFGVSYPIETITSYFTINNRCTYNIKGGYFFLNVQSNYIPFVIMHELLHFYTWKAFGEDMLANGYDSLKYNAIKESLTVLLNIEFKDLMSDRIDNGYPQHKEMRDEISELYTQNCSLKEIVEQLS
jgi:hypothetical protein